MGVIYGVMYAGAGEPSARCDVTSASHAAPWTCRHSVAAAAAQRSTHDLPGPPSTPPLRRSAAIPSGLAAVYLQSSHASRTADMEYLHVCAVLSVEPTAIWPVPAAELRQYPYAATTDFAAGALVVCYLAPPPGGRTDIKIPMQSARSCSSRRNCSPTPEGMRKMQPAELP